MKPKITFTIILLSVLFIVFFLIYMKFYDEQKQNINAGIETYDIPCGKYKQEEIKINSKNIVVDLADDDCKKNLGLSGRTSLKDGRGMIFIFEKLGNYSFWMKDMNFPLDILWINDVFKIVGIEKNVIPNTYPQSFGGKYLAKYVLEVTANYSDKNNIKIGDKIIFSKL